MSVEDIKETHPLGNKKVEDSVTEWTKVLRYDDINSGDRLFGGRLMEWIDEIAGTAAVRHCSEAVTTAAVDNLQFKKGAYLNDIIVIIARITYVGHTSVEVRVDTYVEDRKTGMRHVINRAYLTEVCVDKNGNPITVPYGLEVISESEKAEWAGALKRIAMRKIRRREGY